MEWSPSPDVMQSYIDTLVWSLAGADPTLLQARLDEAHKRPDFALYLVFIMTRGSDIGAPMEIRQVAGLVGRNNISMSMESVIPAANLNLIESMVLGGLIDPEPLIRHTSKNLACTIARNRTALEGWVDLFPFLVRMLNCSVPPAGTATDPMLIIETALATLADLCEDLNDTLNDDILGRPLNSIFPLLLHFGAAPNPQFRRHALAAMYYVHGTTEYPPAILMTHVTQYLQLLAGLAKDPDPGVRKLVCQSLVSLLDRAGDHMLPGLQQLTEFFLFTCQHDASNEVVLAACEYWSALCHASAFEEEDVRDYIISLFPRLLPILVGRLRYSEDELADLPFQDVADEGIPDRIEDVRPFIYKVKEDEEDGDNEETSTWTVRRCCAIDLDTISATFAEDMVPSLIETLSACFREVGDSDHAWQTRECGLLALGCVADGCGAFMVEHFGILLPYLLSQVQDRRPLIRVAACWTLGQYAQYIVSDDSLLPKILPVILPACLDHTKKVQEAALVALTALITNGGDAITPFTSDVLAVFSVGFAKYQARNCHVLYDAVGALSEAVGSELQNEEWARVLLTPLIHRWNTTRDDDEIALPALIECLVFVISAVGPRIQPCAQQIYTRSVLILEQHLTYVYAALAVPGEAAPPKGLIVATLDILSSLCSVLMSDFEALMASDHAKVVPMVVAACQDSAADVKQSGYALLGDLAKYAIVYLKPALPTLLPGLLTDINIERPKVCNNALWSWGEIAKAAGPDAYIASIIRTIIPPVLKFMADAEAHNMLPRSIVENVAVLMGRLSLHSADEMASISGTFLFNWARTIVSVSAPDEIIDACLGFIHVVSRRPDVALLHFEPVMYILAVKVPDSLLEGCKAALAAIQATAGPEFPRLVSELNPELRRVLERKFT